MIPSLPPTGAAPPARDQILLTKARELEAGFLAEMLRHAGAGATPAEFGGGIGEDQFASFLRQAQADAIMRRGGIGLAEQLFKTLRERADVVR